MYNLDIMTSLERIKERSSLEKRLWADLTLLFVAIIWGIAFVAQRIAAAEIGTFTFNGLRFLVGAFVLLPFHFAFNSNGAQFLGVSPSKRNLLGLAAAGLLLVGGSAFQQAGLRYTSAGNAGFITGLYIVFIPIFLAVIWHKQPRAVIWPAALMALFGLFLLSTGGEFRVNRGDGLVLVSSVFWALHVILIGWMVGRMDIYSLSIGQYLICGIVSLFIGLLFEPQGLQPILENWWIIAYTGLISVGMGYTLQAFGQRVAPPADAAIILSMEAVFAALAGWIFIHEVLTPIQIGGCIVMFLGMLLAQSDVIFQKRGSLA